MRIAVLGLGLIGGSLLRALGAAGHQVTGYDADPVTRQLAGAAGSVREAVRDTDVVFLAVPLPALPDLLGDLDGYRGLISDVTSVKGPVAALMAGRRFVGGHPMAGKEHSGFGSSDPLLFRDQPWVLCLDPETDLADWRTMVELLGGLRARIIPATSAEHDAAVARISHVPHLVASAIAASAAEPGVLALAAGSFRDGTRVASTAPALVAAMCSGNAAAVRPVLDELIAALTEARATLDDRAGLIDWLSRGHAVRGRWPLRATPAGEIPTDREGLLELGRQGHSVT
ncbi:prephenate dehydrogenase/arogenate dehydrogenase family protein [Longispora sp. K20-0274]|uniref:prephenate dehydrogenase n=1 Tax=Longispora sp. K20-0274 TaxID=3088255 RepID=UPI00399B8682